LTRFSGGTDQGSVIGELVLGKHHRQSPAPPGLGKKQPVMLLQSVGTIDPVMAFQGSDESLV